jgi:hypothetical protein
MFALGSLYTYISGYLLVSWRTVAWLQVLPCGLFGISVFFVPNSPYWLVEKGREAEAAASLQWLRGPHYDPLPELAEMVEKKRAKEEEGRGVAATLASRTFLLPFLRIGALMMITQWAGINVITSYMVSIFTESGSSLPPGLAPVLVCTVQQALALLSTAVLRVCPRKPLFLACASMIAVSRHHLCSGDGVQVSQAALGTYSYVHPGGTGPHRWVPVAAIISGASRPAWPPGSPQ